MAETALKNGALPFTQAEGGVPKAEIALKTEHCRSRVKLQCADLQPARPLRRSISVHFSEKSPRRSIAVHFCLATFAPPILRTQIKMAGKTKEMSQIKQMLLLKKQGVSNRKIATAVGMNKETVNNYMKKVNADPLSIDESGVGDAAQACHATTSVGRIPPRQP